MNQPMETKRRSLRGSLIPWIIGAGLVTSGLGSFEIPPLQAEQPGSQRVGDSPAPSGGSDQARIDATSGLIQRAGSALNANNFSDAVELYRRARVNARPLPSLQPQVTELRQRLEAVGIDAKLLDMPPSAPPNASPAGQGVQAAELVDFASDPEAAKREVTRLVAQGRNALDRGDIAAALQWVRQAERLGVPESEFDPGQPRVWQLALDVRSAARRAGLDPTSDAPLIDPMIRQAGAVLPAGGAGNGGGDGQVAPSVFLDGGQGSQVQPVQATEAAGGGQGQQLYRQGLDVLADGDTKGARELFVEAWKHEADMDLSTRAQLKEKLTLLQPTRLPEPDEIDAMTPIQRAELESQDETRRLFREITSELARANEMRESAPLEALDRLQNLSRKVAQSKLDEAAATSMTTMVERAIKQQQQYIEANRGQIELDLANDAVRAELASEQQRKARLDDQVASLVQTFNDLMEERRYPEAEMVAKQVAELKPGSSIAKSMHHTSRMGTRLMINEEIAADKEEAVAKTLLDLDRAGTPIDPSNDIHFMPAQSWGELTRRRQMLRDTDSPFSPAEREIQQRLRSPIDVNYRNRPLAEVLEDLGAVAGVPVVLDSRALNEMRIQSDTPVTLDLTQPIEFRNALNLLLADFELTYMVEHDVLKITSHEVKRTRVVTRTYKVADLVTPIPNFTTGYEDGMAGALRAAHQMTRAQADVQVMPMNLAGLASNHTGNPNTKALAQYGSMGPSPLPPHMQGSDPNAFGGGFMPFELMQLIQTTITPELWEDETYRMFPYNQSLSLVISTTTEVHDQISALLESLRKLQNIQITIEVRFITLSDSFFERIGIDFDLSFDDNVRRLPDDDSGPRVVVGWDGSQPTADFDIKLNNEFGVTPSFGAFDAGAGSTLGFAILSDIEAFFFLQAAQGDARTNVLQAPKVTMFDGQIASITDFVQRPFVMSIQPVVGDFAVAQQPIVVVLNEGTQLTVQAVVSDDKRFVRMTLLPYFSQIGEVNEFTFEGRRRRRSNNVERDPVTGEPLNSEEEDDFVEGTTVQQPTLASTSVATTVNVPDGGTILLGGIKRMREGRNERGVPILSKIPYISRLFRNVAIGRDAQSLMMMVTPRIIIQEEEEMSQTGFDPER